MIAPNHPRYKTYPTLKIPLMYVGYAKKKRKVLKIDTGKFFSDAFIPALADKTSVQIYFGGAGSGKSVSIAQRTIIDMLAGARNFLVVRKVKETLKDSFFSELQKAAENLGVDKYFKFTTSPLQIVCKINGTMCIFRGMDKEEKVKSITVRKGIITDIIIEEATELNEPDYEMLETRLRGYCKVPKRITILFNPIHDGHWLYKRFFEGKFPEDQKKVVYEDHFEYVDRSDPLNPKLVKGVRHISIHKSNHWDNKFMMPEDRIMYESWKETNIHMYNVYALGNWGVLGDLVFPDFEIRDLSKVSFTKVHDGMDFGWYPDPTAYVNSAKNGKVLYILNESGGHKDLTEEIAKMIRPLCGSRPVGCDYNEMRTIAGLKELGINTFPVKKWKDNNKHAIEYIKNFKLVVHYECKELIRELRSYVWEKDKDGKHTGRPADGNDHYIQAVFYAYNDLINDYRKTYIGR